MNQMGPTGSTHCHHRRWRRRREGIRTDVPAVHGAVHGSSCAIRGSRFPLQPFSGIIKLTKTSFGLLMLDERLFERPDELFRGILLELMGLRHVSASTIFCVQFKKSDRHAMPGSGIHADVFMDCIVRSAARPYMGKEGMRKRWPKEGCSGLAGSHSRYPGRDSQ